MATPAQTRTPDSAVLRLKRVFRAGREKVFDAWTDPATLNLWFGPSEDYTVNAEVDLRVGGNSRIEMVHKEGGRHVVFGEYEQIDRPETLVYSWSWESGMVSDTRVTVRLTEVRDGTQVDLIHERFPSEPMRDEHNKGWSGCLARLEALANLVE